MITFFSNFLSEHQIPFCNAMYKLTNGEFRFVETEPMSTERIVLGFTDSGRQYPYSVRSYESKDKEQYALELADSSDVVIYGSAPDGLFRQRSHKGKMTFFYSERLYKRGYQWYKMPYRIVKNLCKNSGNRNQYLLSASAFAPWDFALTFQYVGKAYKWGYFPEAKQYNVEALIDNKQLHSILWVGRFINWKHPEICINLAKRLLADGVDDFSINMIGTGTMVEQMKSQILIEHLDNHIFVLGSMKPKEVRKHMVESEIFVFTSDRNEGWGAVLNEAMNSGCAVVASSEIGSVPYLINDNENGLIYQDGNLDDLYAKVKELYNDSNKRKQLGEAAYHTIVDLWNADVAAERLIQLIDDIKKYKMSDRFKTGPCSKADIIKDGWYKG